MDIRNGNFLLIDIWVKDEILGVGYYGIDDNDGILLCEVMVRMFAAGRTTFRITYLSNHNYKHHDFEADNVVAMEIVEKLKNILAFGLSSARNEFLTSEESKIRKRDTLRQ